MSKRKSEPTPKSQFVSRTHISRAEKEAQQRRMVVLGSAIVVGVVLLLLVGGLIYQQFVAPGQTMATVYDEPITRAELYKRINYQRWQAYEEYKTVREQYEQSAADPASSFLAQYMAGQVQQVQQYYGTIGSQTLGILVDERVLQKIADERGIAVSDEEVDNEIRRRIAAEQGASIEIDVTATAEGRVNATATAAQFTPTPEATIDASATVTATETVTDTEIIEETGPTPTPAPTATPNILSDDDFESNYQTLLNTMRSEAGISEADYREIVRMDLLRTKVQADVEQSAELPEGEEQVHVRHLLTETEEEAQAALDRINAGEAFEAVAAEVSTDPSAAQNAGDLGWISREGVVAEFADAAFALTEPGQLSEPVQSQFGWHVIELLEGPEERPLTPERETQLRTQAWNDLLQEERTLSNTLYEWDVQDVPRDKYLSEFQRPLPTAVPAPTIAVDATVPVTVVPDGADDETPADGGEDASESGSE